MSTKPSKGQAKAGGKPVGAVKAPVKGVSPTPPSPAPAAEEDEQTVLVSFLLKLEPNTWAITEIKELEVYPEEGPDQGHSKCIEIPGLADPSKAKTKAWKEEEVLGLNDWASTNVKAVIVHSVTPASPELEESKLVGVRGRDMRVLGETCPTDTKQCAMLMANSVGPITVADLRARGINLDELAARTA